MALTLDKNQISEGIGVIKQACNVDIIADIERLASTIKSGSDDNNLLDGVLENCKRFQNIFNDTFNDSAQKLVEEFGRVYDLTEMIEKAVVDQTSAVDASFASTTTDPGAVNL